MICVKRERESSVKRKQKIEELYSDRSRIIYSSTFRRLQQKAQVFSLESNASVRTRMTHTLEVSDLGRSIANKIAQRLYNEGFLSVRGIPQIVAIVENACLLHDIGNPPFGHFGEAAIRDWANSSIPDFADSAILRNTEFQYLISDFIEFDGNPQGFRIITKLHTEVDKYSFNLTYATLMCAIKYARAAGETNDDGIHKKAGYFNSEKSLVKKIYVNVGVEINHRFPLTYIMEAADDIAYCMSDIADGIEKRILTPQIFREEFIDIWNKNYPNTDLPVKMPKNINNFNMQISIPWSKCAMDQATENFIEYQQDFYNGTAKELIPQDKMGRVLSTIKKVSKNKLYNSIEAESIELTGYAVITGILKHYEKLLKMSQTDFSDLIVNKYVENTDVEKRLLNRIGKRYINAYIYAVNDIRKENDKNFLVHELWLRVHLVIDHVSGMTDEFALETYQMLEGINLLKS